MKKYEELAKNEVLSDLAKALLLKFYTLNSAAKVTRDQNGATLPYSLYVDLFADETLWIEDVLGKVRVETEAEELLNELSKQRNVTL